MWRCGRQDRVHRNAQKNVAGGFSYRTGAVSCYLTKSAGLMPSITISSSHNSALFLARKLMALTAAAPVLQGTLIDVFGMTAAGMVDVDQS